MESGERRSWTHRVCRGGQTHREFLCTRVDKRKLCLIIQTSHTVVWRSVPESRRMYRILWVKCTTPAGCKSIRIAVSTVMDGWNGRFLAVLALSKKVIYDRKEGQLRTGYLGGTPEVMMMMMFYGQPWVGPRRKKHGLPPA